MTEKNKGTAGILYDMSIGNIPVANQDIVDETLLGQVERAKLNDFVNIQQQLNNANVRDSQGRIKNTSYLR
jgi:hypothetical protein